jgi:hypothetical protein
MGRPAPIAAGNEVKLFDSFPRLKFENPGEKLLIAATEDPTVVYVHTLKRPKLVNGKPVMVIKTNKDKTKSWEEIDTEFVSRPQCLGDEGILEERGMDPKNCPACAVAKKNDTVDSPQLRYAMHVFQYATKPGSHDLSSPFGGQVKVWTFTVRTYNKLIDIVKDTEKALGDTDLMLECISKEFQSFDLRNSSKAMWQKTTANREHVETALAENRAEDLDALSGRKMTRDAMQDDLDAIEEAWKMANGNADDIAAADRQNLNGALGDVLKGASSMATPAAPVPTETDTPAPTSGEDADGFAELLALRKQ